METVKEVLVAAKDVIRTPETWCQGYYAKNSQGERVSPFAEDACQFCSIGAVEKILGYERTDLFTSVIEVLSSCARDVLDNTLSAKIAVYNDSSTHEQIMQLFDCAITKQGE